MVELFEQHLYTVDRQSSKGNQLKWQSKDIWYKADYTGFMSFWSKEENIVIYFVKLL